MLVLSQGRVVYEEGKLQAQQGTGRFIPCKPFPDYAYQRIKFRNQVKKTDDFKGISMTVFKIVHVKMFPLKRLSVKRVAAQFLFLFVLTVSVKYTG